MLATHPSSAALACGLGNCHRRGEPIVPPLSLSTKRPTAWILRSRPELGPQVELRPAPLHRQKGLSRTEILGSLRGATRLPPALSFQLAFPAPQSTDADAIPIRGRCARYLVARDRTAACCNAAQHQAHTADHRMRFRRPPGYIRTSAQPTRASATRFSRETSPARRLVALTAIADQAPETPDWNRRAIRRCILGGGRRYKSCAASGSAAPFAQMVR